MSDFDVSHDINDVAKAVSVAGGAAGAAVTFSGQSVAEVAGEVNELGAGEAILGSIEGAELITTVGAAGEIETIAAGAVLGTTAAAVGVGLSGGLMFGEGIEYLTDGAPSDLISNGLKNLVGEDESNKAVQSFDEGNYLEGAGHMASGAWKGVKSFFGGDDDDGGNGCMTQ